MPVVCDTSPISYLVRIGEVEILSTLYGEVWIPEAVRSELTHPDGPASLREWMARPPAWLKVKEVAGTAEEESEELLDLDGGERAAILLAEQERADLLVLDERAGRAVARARGLTLTGTIGALGAAAVDGLIDTAAVVRRLRRTSFRAAPDLYRWLLNQQP